MLSRYALLSLAAFSLAAVAGCEDTTPKPPPPPETPATIAPAAPGKPAAQGPVSAPLKGPIND